MKTCILLVIFAVSLLALVGEWSAAAPVPETGRPQEIASFEAHQFDVQCLAFSPDGKILASGGSDGRLKLWDTVRGNNLLDIQAYRSSLHVHGYVCGVAFSPDGRTLASCDDWGKVKLWNAATGTNTDTLDAKLLDPLLFSPDGKTLVSRDELFDLEKKKARKIVDKPGMWPVASFDAQGKLRVGASFGYPDPPSFAVWDVESGKKILIYKGERKIVSFESFDPDGKTAVSSEGDYETRRWVLRLWDIASGKNTVTIEQPEIPIHPTFSPDGKVLAVSCRPAADRNDGPGSIRLYEVASGKILATLKGYKRAAGSMVFSPDGRLLASADAQGVIKIWRLPARYKAE